MDIFVLWFLVWCLLQLFAKEPARTIILVAGILIAILSVAWPHLLVLHPIR